MERDFDGPWKETLDHFLSELLEFFVPELWNLVDWSVSPENLETELQKIIGDAVLGNTTADRLFRLRERDTAADIYLLLHVEVQAQVDVNLPQRMYVYHNRIFELHGQHPIGIAILADPSPNWRPSTYRWAKANCEVNYHFGTIKLWDWRDRLEELLASQNMIGLAVVAHLQSHLTINDMGERYHWKSRLIELLNERGLPQSRGFFLFKVIDWFLNLPSLLEDQFSKQIQEKRQERIMEYRGTLVRLKELWRAEFKEEVEQEVKREVKQDLKRELKQELKEEQDKQRMRFLSATLTSKFGEAGKTYVMELLSQPNLEFTDSLGEAVFAANSLEEIKNLILSSGRQTES